MAVGVLRPHHITALKDLLSSSAEQPVLTTESSTSVVNLSISWCSSELNWQVIAPWPGTARAPDVVCEGAPDFDPLSASTPAGPAAADLRRSLLNWDPVQDDALLLLLRALLRAFCDHQLAQLHLLQNDRLQFELSTLPDTPGLEALLVDDAAQGQQASFGIPLDALDLSKLHPLLPPPPCPLHSPTSSVGAAPSLGQQPQHQEQGAGEGGSAPPALSPGDFKLEITFPVAAMENPQLSLRVPEALRRLLQPSPLPSWSRQSCLMEYVPLLVERLQQQVDALAARLSLRVQVVEAMQEVVGPPLEVNPWQLVACWQVAWEGSVVLLLLELGGTFPEEAPTITVQSLRHMGGAGHQMVLRRVPWSPRWSAREMAGRIFNHVKEQLPSVVGVPTA